MVNAFPAVGRKYLVTFTAEDGVDQFRVQLDFHSNTSLTYTGVRADGSLTNNTETVEISVEPIGELLFLVTWQEESGTTVVHIEDYSKNTIITNITSPTGKPTKPNVSK